MQAADPELGLELSGHRQSYTYRVILGLVCAPFALGGLALVPDAPEAGSGMVAAAVCVTALFAWHQARETLAVQGHGLRLVSGGRSRRMLWREIAKAAPRYSYTVAPEALMPATLRSREGKRLELAMDWARRRELSRVLLAVLREGVTHLEATAPKPPAAPRVTSGAAVVRRRALLRLRPARPCPSSAAAGTSYRAGRAP